MEIEILKKIWVGKKIIAIGNGYQTNSKFEKLSIGIVKDVIPVSQANSPFPVVDFVGEDEDKLCFSCVIMYSELLHNALLKLTAEERYRLIEAYCNRFSER